MTDTHIAQYIVVIILLNACDAIDNFYGIYRSRSHAMREIVSFCWFMRQLSKNYQQPTVLSIDNDKNKKRRVMPAVFCVILLPQIKRFINSRLMRLPSARRSLFGSKRS